MTTTTQVGSTSTTGSLSSSMLGGAAEQKDMFLKLLVAQLRNQDPSSPMDQKDMMAQMAQFTSVEQMTNMVKTLETLTFNSTVSQSVALIGKTVDYTSTATDGTASIASSRVTAVATSDGEVKLVLEDGSTIVPGDVVKVTQ